jgi:uncharacterized membrane protein
MATEHNATHTTTVHHAEGKNPMAFLAYLWILILIPFFTDAKNDPFVKYHLQQGIVLIIFDAVGWFLGFFIGWIPLIGGLIIGLWWLASLILVIIGLVNVANGKEQELPFIGQYARNFKF